MSPDETLTAPRLEHLVNRYFALRHGTSEANVAGIIASSPDNGLRSFGLTKEGRADVAHSISEAFSLGHLDKKTHVCASPFLRTRQSAEVAGLVLGVKKISIQVALRERDFGDLELTSNANYDPVWEEDARDATHSLFSVESAAAVLSRTTALVLAFERAYVARTILLVSHGDTLQIMQCAFQRLAPEHHRTLPSLAVGELRELLLVP
jgi:broad specificity phosphatase PhoE